jgi:hypothetical protein
MTSMLMMDIIDKVDRQASASNKKEIDDEKKVAVREKWRKGRMGWFELPLSREEANGGEHVFDHLANKLQRRKIQRHWRRC